MEFWDAVRKVTDCCPQSEWTWADWLSVIDLADVPCYHPIRYRLAVGGYWKDDGTSVAVVSDNRVFDVPGLAEEIAKASNGDNPYVTFCEVCWTFCPSPPVDIRARREKLLALILFCIAETTKEKP